ncbi:MAG: hypothetical protein U5J98_02890 [Halobacteriales archaeon]|nr:hypothetical protein [Halobacteriales archaeon]
MTRTILIGLVLAALLLGGLASPAAAQPVDDCQNADRGPDGDGPPGFVASLVPDFLSDLIGSLPVPNFVKSFFGASTC